MILLGLATIIQSFYDFYFSGRFYGLPGNWNWNATLIALTLPFLCFGIYRYFRKHDKVSFWLSAFVAFGGVALILYCQSKGTVLALIIACCSILILRYWRKMPWVYWLRTGIFLVVIGIILLWIFAEQLFIVFREDQRFFLWSGALGLIRENLWFGCGPDLFESAYAPHIPISYYLGRLVATLHDHVHNHLLQFAATMGIPALIAWCSVIVYVVIKNVRQVLGAGNWHLKLYLFIFVLLFIHSMFDIVILTWPLGCIFLIVFGILLGRALEQGTSKLAVTAAQKIFRIEHAKYILWFSCIAGFCGIIILLNYLYLNLFSSLHFRNVRMMPPTKNIKTFFQETKKSIAFKKTPQNTYLAAKVSLYDFKNPQKCLEYLDMLSDLGFKNYEYSNLLRAKALFASNNRTKSLLYFAQEQDNFPLSCVNLFYYRLTLSKLGRKEQAHAIDRHLKKILKLKGFNESILPTLLKDPDKDLRFKTFNKSRTK